MIRQSDHIFDECTFIILGATGDLTRRKLLPALYKLFASKRLQRFALIGVANSPSSIQAIFEDARQFIPSIDQNTWEKLLQFSYFYKMDFHQTDSYEGLSELINNVEHTHKLKRNRLFYLATMPSHFEVITHNLADYGIAEKHKTGHLTERGTWNRVVYEKPFGYNLKSARQINKVIARAFDEKQVFRIDHYLGKELVANIALARFTNRVFEPLWNNNHIDSVQIVLSETVGIEKRGALYDSCGALKDVVQNHMLQILALIAMDEPEKFTAEFLRNAKAKVLSKCTVESVILGQYQGYKTEPYVNPESTTETFAALKIVINNKRWRKVPFYLKTGKGLALNEASIHIKFKMAKCLLNFCPMDSNYLTIKIQPDEGFYLELNAKAPGFFDQVVPVNMNFSHSTVLGPNTPEAYEVLLADVVRGDHFAFVRSDEIDYSWKIIDQVEKMRGTLYTYKPGSIGPQEIVTLDKERLIKWRA